MNSNIVERIQSRGGSDGWAIAEDASAMTKSFEFETFEQANYFCQSVTSFCNEKDHHPEWSVADGGRTVEVRLTTHWAGNTVTRSDFELAEEMNNAASTVGRFIPYPTYFWHDSKQLASW
jgi:4a-hydroxytetrahydrobiopterin dehydratase